MTDPDVRATVLAVLSDFGVAPGSDLHGWRCYYPDRYGSCTCAEELADALVARLAGQATP